MSDEKPGWGDAPAWAKYLAQDQDGGWYWYESRPTISTSNPVWMRAGGTKTARAGWSSNGLYTWRNSLETREPPARKPFPARP